MSVQNLKIKYYLEKRKYHKLFEIDLFDDDSFIGCYILDLLVLFNEPGFDEYFLKHIDIQKSIVEPKYFLTFDLFEEYIKLLNNNNIRWSDSAICDFCYRYYLICNVMTQSYTDSLDELKRKNLMIKFEEMKRIMVSNIEKFIKQIDPTRLYDMLNYVDSNGKNALYYSYKFDWFFNSYPLYDLLVMYGAKKKPGVFRSLYNYIDEKLASLI